MSNQSGVLYVVATPIGNLGDISRRGIEVLGDVDVILAEDTRHSAKLLRNLGLSTPMQALHDHNESGAAQALVARLLSGVSMALISDAGTPLISDPGYHLVRAARAAQIKVTPIPGPSAFVAALCVSGIPAASFVFNGFLPSTAGARRATLEGLRNERRTLVFYEAPHRIMASIRDAAEVFGARRSAVLARELTKTFETVLAGELGELVTTLERDENQRRGEFVVIVSGNADTDLAWQRSLSTLSSLVEELPLKQAVSLAAKITGEKKNRLYQAALEMRATAGSC